MRKMWNSGSKKAERLLGYPKSLPPVLRICLEVESLRNKSIKTSSLGWAPVPVASSEEELVKGQREEG